MTTAAVTAVIIHARLSKVCKALAEWLLPRKKKDTIFILIIEVNERNIQVNKMKKGRKEKGKERPAYQSLLELSLWNLDLRWVLGKKRKR